MKYRIELEEQGNNWLIVTTASDGIVDILGEFTTHEQAAAECKQWNRDYENALNTEAE